MLIAFWIVVVGALVNQLTPNLFSPDPGTVAGNVVMVGGLVTAGQVSVPGPSPVRGSATGTPPAAARDLDSEVGRTTSRPPFIGLTPLTLESA